MRSILLAGVQSGCGKTTVTLALIQYLMARKLLVRGFKSGPDFLDPLWHKKLTGFNSYNLDTRMIGIIESKEKLDWAKEKNTDIAIIEGVMGLFDGRQGVGEDGSSVHLAQSLGIDVWLVVDARGMSGSIVPLVAGFKNYAEKCGAKISGIIANRVGSAHHAKLLKEQLNTHNLPPLLAWMDKSVPSLPERHLGLVRPNEHSLPDISSHLHLETDDLSGMIPAYSSIKDKASESANARQTLMNKKIAVAYDDACCFIYPANIDWLKQQGAELQFFSPLEGESVPADCDALWLPGGYPELYAQQLEYSPGLASIRDFADSHKPILAECGGMMLLGKTLIDLQGKQWHMADILAVETTMKSKLASLGYRECLSGPYAGLKGHEYHHSIRNDLTGIKTAFDVSRGDQGIVQGTIIASYIHWYFPSAPAAAARFFLPPEGH